MKYAGIILCDILSIFIYIVRRDGRQRSARRYSILA